MMNHTVQLLKHAAWRLQQERPDPEYEEWERRCQTLWQDFRQQHRHNKALRKQALRLLDAQAARDDCRTRALFLLGLQMGLELGALDMLETE